MRIDEDNRPLCLVPARGGSKRLPRKNILPLNGKPLVAWTIDAARESGIFDEIVISSDDSETLHIAEQFGAVPLVRPGDLAEDLATVVQVCEYTLQQMLRQGKQYPALYVMLPTSPFRRPETIRAAWQAFQTSAADALLSVVSPDHPPQWSLKEESGFLQPLSPRDYETPRGKLVPAWVHDGGHAIVRTSSFLEKPVFMGERTMHFPVSREESVDINEPLDLDWAEFLIKSGRI